MNGDKQEFYAESVHEAVSKASASLGISPEQLQYEVLDEGSSGFLGIGARDARIVVTAPISSITPSSESEAVVVPATSERAPDTSEVETPEVDVVPEDSGVLTDAPEGEAPVPEDAPEDLILAVDGFATELLEKMGFDATVDAYDAGEVIRVDIATAETGLLIGQKGETIDAIQYLLNVFVYKSRPFLKRITVDTEGYRQRRVEALQGMAHRTARRAQREKRPLNLPPMPAAERRVVHLYLKENPNVSTSSEGGEDDRRVVITPNY
ncbi:KH domain-containing protein [Rubrobacter marinus]|uniref:RNA-binding protein KhpB n=1 Tax=Rubrobacter marinus TaxID=2653852 RepID=A0A6G8Q289_9ACTN|nr:RNA-binding cell elongation regulator Jag/EloR [Rubrobacter marinus]QIN80569.1 KH domain-containing protein [Rubrobacter marinus]